MGGARDYGALTVPEQPRYPVADSRPSPQPSAKPSPITPRRVLVVLLLAAVVAFVVQNTSAIELSWLFFGFSAPLWLLAVILLAVGFVIGWFVGRPSRRERRD